MTIQTKVKTETRFTPGPWFGPNYNSSTAEPTRAMTGKFKPRGHKTPSDYDLRVEISGDNVGADAALIQTAPELYGVLSELCEWLRNAGTPPKNLVAQACVVLAKARRDVVVA